MVLERSVVENSKRERERDLFRTGKWLEIVHLGQVGGSLKKKRR